MEKIKYCKGYKYQLREDYSLQTNVLPKEDIHTELVSLTKDGLLTIRKYFAWDGCSGPTIDDRTNTRACFVHDVFYYLMRMGMLDCLWREVIDSMLEDMMIEDGALPIRAAYYHSAVHMLAGRCASPKSARKVYEAP